ncbi:MULTISPECIES: ECF transporter S component [Clostridiaceae]|uniref:ECF transporter S component n=1 Tax=Clostridiaceae TaxID=31979 RepID=UPI0005594AED|nr:MULTISPECIES: ECF transporter S component [Clostridiaceae]
MKQNIVRNETSSSKAIELTQMALMTAIICVATMSIKIPTVMGIGYDHLGDSMIFFAAILFGRKKGAITSAIGMSLADLLSGYAYYVPFTFVIKGIMALIATTIAYRGNYEGKNMINNIFAFVVAGAWMVFGYFVAKIILVKFVLFKVDTYSEALALGLASIPNNIGQVTVGILIAVPLIKLLQGKLNIKRK